MPDVANLSVVVSADTTAAEKGLSDLGSKVSGVGSAITGALGGAAVAAVAGLGVAFVGSVKSAADFEKQMSAISAVTGSTETEMQALTSTALQLGKDTSFSASEAAAGMEELAKAGVSVADIIGGAGRASLDLAAAGAVSVADAAEIASNALNVFNLSGTDMAHVADQIAGAANASAIGVNDYKFSLSSAGAVAATVGVSFEDLTTSIAAMGNAGIKGSDAGTSLKTMLLNLQPTTKANYDAFQDLGLLTYDAQAAMDVLRSRGIEPLMDGSKDLTTQILEQVMGIKNVTKMSDAQKQAFNKLATETGIFKNEMFDATGSVKGMEQIAGLLHERTKDMTDAQKLMTLEMAFGSDAIRAAAVLAGEGAEGFAELAAQIGKVSAQQVAEERLNNLWGSLEKLKGSLETGAIMLGSLFTPALKSLADMLTTQVNAGIAVLEQLPDVMRTVQQVMEGTWETSDTIQPFTRAIGEMAVAFRDDLWPALRPVVAFVTDALVPALADAGRFLAAHPGLIAALVAAWGTFVVLTTVVGWITGAIAAFGALSSAITAAGGVVGAIIAILGGPLTLVILAVAAVVGLLVVAWTENWFGIQEITAQAVAFLTEAFNGLVAFLQTTWTSIVEATTAAWTAVSEAFTTGVATVQGLWDAGWKAITAILTAAWNLLTTENQTRITELIALVTELWQLLPQLWTVGTQALTTLMTTWWADTTTAWTTAQTAIAETVAPWWTTIQGYWDTALKAIQDALAVAWAAIVAATGTFFTDLGAQFTGAVGTLGQAATDLGTAIMEALRTAINNKVQSIVDGVTGAVKSALDAARSLIGGASGSSGNAAWDAIAREEGVDPALLASLIQQESGGRQSARSGAGAIGLTQLMPGTAAGLGVDPYDELQNVRGGARYLKQMIDQFGDVERALIAYNAGPAGGAPGESRAYAQRVLAGRATVPSGVAAAQRAAVPQLNQFGMQGGTLTAAEAAAFCGPAAAMWFANIYGRMPDKAEAEAMARSVGWTPGFGMAGPGSQQRLLGLMGVGANVDYTPTPAEIAALAAQNVPFQISTQGGNGLAGHYYQVQGGTLGALNVGGSGEALKGGSAVMSLDQITALSGAMNGIITLAPQMGAALASSSAVGGTALQGLLLSATTLADGSVVAITEMGGQITASIVSSTGQVTATYGAMATAVTTDTAMMATGVTTNTNLMATGALTSVTAMEAGILTTVQTTSGTTIATVTDMQGQVTSQYATLANGAMLTMGDMAAGILTSTTDLGTGIMTTVQDMSGNYITTITDLSGNVTSQYVSLGEGATQATAQMAADVTAETATMATDVVAGTTEMSREALTSVTDMGDGIITITRDASGEMVATITDMAGNVTSTYSSMSSDVTGTAEEMANTVVETMESAGGDIAGAVEEWGSSIGEELESIAGDAQDQAAEIGSGITDGIAEGIEDGSDAVMDAVRDVVEEAIDEAKDEAESDSPSKLFARELGYPIAAGVAAGIEKGSGLVADATRGLVGAPEYTAPAYGTGGSGGMQTIVIQIDLGGSVAEELYVNGRELAVKRGRA